MSSPVSRAAMPLEALQTAITIPRIRTVSELAEDRVVAEWTAWVKTPEAPGGSAVTRPFTSRCTVAAPTWANVNRPSTAGRRGAAQACRHVVLPRDYIIYRPVHPCSSRAARLGILIAAGE